MSPADYARLTLLAAIWGGAFPFMRVTAPAFGALWTAELRVLLGGLVLLAWLRLSGFDPQLRKHARTYLILGAVIIALPFSLYAYAATRAPAALLAVVNSTAPMFALLWSAAFRDERLTGRRVIGLLFGAAGVACIAGPADLDPEGQVLWAVGAALTACCGYGVTGVLMKRIAGDASPRGMAAGNQIGAALVILPLLLFQPLPAAPSTLAVANLLGLALLASGVAFVLYFRLIADVGATKALTVTYLIPLFGVLWGWLFLGETLPLGALAGGALILAGTFLVTRG